jgi:NAD(P)-dependent dehydrogenase (short-subunit alcohol dehydrogenase family)
MLTRRQSTNGSGALSGRHAAITRASRGIGKAIALALAEAGADVAIIGRSVGPHYQHRICPFETGQSLPALVHRRETRRAGPERALAVEILPHDITVNAICPGHVDTPLTDKNIAQISVLSGRSKSEIREALEVASRQYRLRSLRRSRHSLYPSAGLQRRTPSRGFREKGKIQCC